MIMARFIFIGLTIIIILSSCNKQDDHLILPDGLFTETSPVKNRSQLEFINGNLMIQSEVGSSIKDTFYYEVINDKIKLTSAWNNQYLSSELAFKMISVSKFEIQDLYPSIPEAPRTFMIFEK